MKAENTEIRFEPGYNCFSGCSKGSERCEPGAGGFHGQHGMSIRFILHGHEGSVQWLIYTSWTPAGVDGEHREPKGSHWLERPFMAADLGYHWDTNPYDDGDWLRQDSCDLRLQGHCFYDGSGLNAERLVEPFLAGGEDAVWQHLFEFYEEVRGYANSN